MVENSQDFLVLKALKGIAEEEQNIFIDSKNISEEDLKQALLTAVDINILREAYQDPVVLNGVLIKEKVK